MRDATATIDDARWREFEREGWLRLGRTLDDDALEGLRDRIDDYMLGKRRDDGLMMQIDLGGDYGALADATLGFKGPRLDYRKIENLERDDRFREFLGRPLFRDLSARAYGRGVDIGIYRAMFMNKPAAKGTLLPWHQDGGLTWNLDRDPLLTVWTALDPATIANGCVQIIPGSHRLGLLSARGHTISAEHEAAHCRPEQVVHIELAAGESVLLHNFTLHRSDINRTSTPRRAFSCCYLDARTRHRDGGQGFEVMFAAEPAPVAG